MVPKISIIVPVYNMATYVGQCIDSVLKQNFHDFELIVVNDGSTDNSLDIINNYATHDNRVRVINKENAGLGSTYNAGQEAAVGKYIYFLDADDWMKQGCLKTLFDVAEKTNAEVVKSWGFFPESKEKYWEQKTIPAQKCDTLITNMLTIPEFVSGHVAQWTCLYRRDFLLNNKIWCLEYPAQMSPDINLMFHIWAKCKRLYIVPKSFIHYRIDNQNSAKNSGSAMSFRLLRAHLGARSTLANLYLPKPYWYVKAKVEFRHLVSEFENHRCSKNRREFLRGVAKIFRENIKHGLINWKDLSPVNVRKYKLIAYAPGFYWLNDAVRFWAKSKDKANNTTTYWRLFGIYKRVEYKTETRIYLCGLLARKKKK